MGKCLLAENIVFTATTEPECLECASVAGTVLRALRALMHLILTVTYEAGVIVIATVEKLKH